VKIGRREIIVLVVTLFLGVTANAWWRVKETGRRARIAAQHEAELREAGLSDGGDQ
jgi:hypothetical protein